MLVKRFFSLRASKPSSQTKFLWNLDAQTWNTRSLLLNSVPIKFITLRFFWHLTKRSSHFAEKHQATIWTFSWSSWSSRFHFLKSNSLPKLVSRFSSSQNFFVMLSKTNASSLFYVMKSQQTNPSKVYFKFIFQKWRVKICVKQYSLQCSIPSEKKKFRG